MPAAQALVSSERRDLERKAAEIEAFIGPVPLEDPRAEAEMLVVVTKLMMALPAQKATAAGVEAQGELYQAALDDVPPWAVRAAIRRWARGDCGSKYDYHWRPGPADLRSVSLTELWRVRSQAELVRALLEAEHLIEYTAEHRGTMLTRLRDALQFGRGEPA